MARDQERTRLKEAYPGSESWARRVDHMTDDQVIAIYLRLKSQGKVN